MIASNYSGEGQTPSEYLAEKAKGHADFMERVVKRAKQIKRKRRLQNKYCLTR